MFYAGATVAPLIGSYTSPVDQRRCSRTASRRATPTTARFLALPAVSAPVSGGSERYTYDSEGVMVRALDTSDSSWSVYVDGIYEQHSDGSITKYYHLHGRPVAVRQVPSGGGSGDLYYLLSDHLGSTSKVLNDTGGVESEIAYWPYGGMRGVSGTPATDLLFTGQREEPGDVAGLGLYNYKARFYSTTLGRFLSPDPVEGPNRFAYVRNNPTTYVDPSGFKCRLPRPNPRDCLGGTKDLVVDAVRGAAAISQQTWAYLRAEIDRTNQRIRETGANIWNAAKNNARAAWRSTYPERARFTIGLEAMVFSEARNWRAFQAIRHIPGAEFGLQFGVTLVIGCTSPTCNAMASLGNAAFTIGHTIFFMSWDLDRIENHLGEFLELLAHELVHVAQYEDWGDLFWPVYIGHGTWMLLRHCVTNPGCDWNDVWHQQWLERTAEDGTYP